jgi:hypothetical protein
MTPNAEKWWHLFNGNHEDCCDLNLMLEETLAHPEELMADLGQSLPTVVCPMCNKLVLLVYLRSWNREPTDEEKEVGLSNGT